MRNMATVPMVEPIRMETWNQTFEIDLFNIINQVSIYFKSYNGSLLNSEVYQCIQEWMDTKVTGCQPTIDIHLFIYVFMYLFIYHVHG